jgi:FkbM family methyltransferase
MSMSADSPLRGAVRSFWELAGRPVNALLDHFGYRVARIQEQITMAAALRRAAERRIRAGTIVDVGASDGRWADIARPCFPDARLLMIEANPVHEPALRTFTSRVPGSEYVLCAAGDAVGELYFDASDPFGGLAGVDGAGGKTIKVPATTVDREVQRLGLPGPYLLKLDTHGYELPILRGAAATLAQASLLVIEVYNFTVTPGSLRFWEMCQHLAPLGFRPIDVCDLLYRPKDGAFWQCDMLFVRADRPEFDSSTYE